MKKLTGKVVSTKMAKTIIVEVERKKLHPLYKKLIKRRKRYKVHHEKGNIKVGETVAILATRPISREKHYKVL